MQDHAVQGRSDAGVDAARLLTLLAAEDGDAEAALASLLGLPRLEVSYWLADDERWVDRDGQRRDLDPAAPGVTVVRWRGRRVAALSCGTPAPADVELSGALGAAIGLALENERLRLALRARLDEQRALRRVATVVARQHEPGEVLDLVTTEVARHLGADAAMTARFEGPERATVLSDWSAPGVPGMPVGRRIAVRGRQGFAQVQRTLAPARVDSYDGMPGDYPEELRRLGVRASVAAPILVEGELWGAVAAASTGGPFAPNAEQRLGAFAELIGQAIANVDARMRLDASRARIVQAADDARRRLERDLHDGAQQRLVALALSLRMVARDADAATAAQLQACAVELETALGELRELAQGIHPAVLSERGLEAALGSLAARAPLPVTVDARLDSRLPAPQEAALYFVAAEALTNVAKHAAATSTSVTVRRRDGVAEIAIADDGVGGAAPDGGSGLRGLADRLDALHGRLSVDSAPGRGTTVRAVVPVT